MPRSVAEASTQTEDTNEKKYEYAPLCDDRADRVRANEHYNDRENIHDRSGRGDNDDGNDHNLHGRNGDNVYARQDDRGQEQRRTSLVRIERTGTNRQRGW